MQNVEKFCGGLPAGRHFGNHAVPFSLTPPILSYQHHAYPLSIASTCDGFEAWLSNNYILTFFASPANYQGAFNFIRPPISAPGFFLSVLDFHTFPWDTMRGMGNTIYDILACIVRDGYAPLLVVDDYYIPFRPSYIKRHVAHDLMLVGVDGANRTFSALGYNHSQWRVHEICADNIRMSLESSWRGNLEHARLFPNINRIRMFRARRAPELCPNVEWIRAQCDLFVNGGSPNSLYGRCGYSMRLDSSWSFGMKAQRAALSLLYTDWKAKRELDLRSLRAIWEHKQIMVRRARLLGKAGVLKGSELIAKFEAIADHYMRLFYTATDAAVRGSCIEDGLIVGVEPLLFREDQALREFVQAIA